MHPNSYMNSPVPTQSRHSGPPTLHNSAPTPPQLYMHANASTGAHPPTSIHTSHIRIMMTASTYHAAIQQTTLHMA